MRFSQVDVFTRVPIFTPRAELPFAGVRERIQDIGLDSFPDNGDVIWPGTMAEDWKRLA